MCGCELCVGMCVCVCVHACVLMCYTCACVKQCCETINFSPYANDLQAITTLLYMQKELFPPFSLNALCRDILLAFSTQSALPR